MKDEGKRNPRIKPHEEEEEWDWKTYQSKPPEDDLDDLDDELDDSNEGDQDAKTKGKQEQTED